MPHLGSFISNNSTKYEISHPCWWHSYYIHICHSFKFTFHATPLIKLPTYIPEWTRTNCSSTHPKLNFFSSIQNKNVSNFLISQLHLLAMILSQSAPPLAILIGFIFVMICFSQINSTLCLNLVSFISVASVVLNTVWITVNPNGFQYNKNFISISWNKVEML